jgi:hypothetical protein
MLGASVVVTLSAGCAGLPQTGLSNESPKAAKEQAVAARADAYWKALIGGDYEAAYGFLSPASRESIPFARFKGLMESAGVVRRAAKVEKVECEVAVCKAATSVTFDHALMKGIVTFNEETWIIDSGQAWLVRKL